MQLADVNVLVDAFRPEAAGHERCRAWLENLISGSQRYAASELILAAVIRILTNARIYERPEKIETAFAYADFVRTQPHCVVINPGPRHWQIFSQLCGESRIAGGMVSDAYLAALAIEHGCEWVTRDRHFARFPGLRWRHPLD